MSMATSEPDTPGPSDNGVRRTSVIGSETTGTIPVHLLFRDERRSASGMSGPTMLSASAPRSSRPADNDDEDDGGPATEPMPPLDPTEDDASAVGAAPVVRATVASDPSVGYAKPVREAHVVRVAGPADPPRSARTADAGRYAGTGSAATAARPTPYAGRGRTVRAATAIGWGTYAGPGGAASGARAVGEPELSGGWQVKLLRPARAQASGRYAGPEGAARAAKAVGLPDLSEGWSAAPEAMGVGAPDPSGGCLAESSDPTTAEAPGGYAGSDVASEVSAVGSPDPWDGWSAVPEAPGGYAGSDVASEVSAVGTPDPWDGWSAAPVASAVGTLHPSAGSDVASEVSVVGSPDPWDGWSAVPEAPGGYAGSDVASEVSVVGTPDPWDGWSAGPVASAVGTLHPSAGSDVASEVSVVGTPDPWDGWSAAPEAPSGYAGSDVAPVATVVGMPDPSAEWSAAPEAHGGYAGSDAPVATAVGTREPSASYPADPRSVRMDGPGGETPLPSAVGSSEAAPEPTESASASDSGESPLAPAASGAADGATVTGSARPGAPASEVRFGTGLSSVGTGLGSVGAAPGGTGDDFPLDPPAPAPEPTGGASEATDDGIPLSSPGSPATGVAPAASRHETADAAALDDSLRKATDHRLAPPPGSPVNSVDPRSALLAGPLPHAADLQPTPPADPTLSSPPPTTDSRPAPSAPAANGRPGGATAVGRTGAAAGRSPGGRSARSSARAVPIVEPRLRERPGPVLPGWTGLVAGAAALGGCALVLWGAGAVPQAVTQRLGLPSNPYQGVHLAQWVLLALGVIVALFALGGLGRGRVGYAWVLTLFGEYRGSVRRTGLVWVSPLLLRRRVDVRLRHWRSEPLPAVDAKGTALRVVVLVVWRVRDTVRAVLSVEDHEEYLREQVEAAMARVLSQLPADAFHEDAPTLRDAEVVGEALTRMLSAQCAPVGIEVFSAQPTGIEYAPEIAAAMQRRRIAAIDAKHRDSVLTSVVDAVDDVVHRLTTRGLVELDDYERKGLVKDLTVAFYTGRSGPVEVP